MAKEKASNHFNLPFNLPIFKKESKKEQSAKTASRLKMVFFIVDWDKTELISKVFEEEKVRYHFINKGMGTAQSDVLDLLGIGASEKAVIICLEQEVLVPILLKETQKKFGFHRAGAGIAFTIPLSGINTPLLKVFKESIHKNEKIAIEWEGEFMPPQKQGHSPIEINNDLVVAIINHGFIDDFMNTAREAGATGGTVIHARGLSHKGPVKFFGVSVQDEKEIVLVLTSREKKLSLMEALSQSHGITSKAEGLIFSLPVDSVMGLNLD